MYKCHVEAATIATKNNTSQFCKVSGAGGCTFRPYYPSRNSDYAPEIGCKDYLFEYFIVQVPTFQENIVKLM